MKVSGRGPDCKRVFRAPCMGLVAFGRDKQSASAAALTSAPRRLVVSPPVAAPEGGRHQLAARTFFAATTPRATRIAIRSSFFIASPYPADRR